MRILWQLIQGGAIGLVLLGGCTLVFKRRAGIVLIHAGVGLMMFNELYVGLTSVEGQMTLTAGDVHNYVEDVRSVELAVVDPSESNKDDVVVVPKSLLLLGSWTTENFCLSTSKSSASCKTLRSSPSSRANRTQRPQAWDEPKSRSSGDPARGETTPTAKSTARPLMSNCLTSRPASHWGRIYFPWN